jgi:hypothetical protein
MQSQARDHGSIHSCGFHIYFHFPIVSFADTTPVTKAFEPWFGKLGEGRNPGDKSPHAAAIWL